MTDKIYKTDSKQIVDKMFDLKLFKDSVTRDDMNGFEDLIEYLLKCRYESYVRCWRIYEKDKAKTD